MRITIITLLHLSKVIILTLILRGLLICESANIRVYMVLTVSYGKVDGILRTVSYSEIDGSCEGLTRHLGD